MTDNMQNELFAFLDGTPLESGGCCIIAAEWGAYDDTNRSTRLLLFDGSCFDFVDIDANIISVAKITIINRVAVVALSVDGRIFIIEQKKVIEELLPRSITGPMTRLYSSENETYAIGTAGQIFYRSNKGWTTLDDGVFDPRPIIDAPQLRDITIGFSSQITAVGCFGLMLKNECGIWFAQSIPTNIDLEQIVKFRNKLWVCGAHGFLMSGSNDLWEVIDSTTLKNIWGLTGYQEKIYFTTLESIYVCDSEGIVKNVDLKLEQPISLYKLASDENFLWSFGLTDVLRFDGKKWEKIL